MITDWTLSETAEACEIVEGLWLGPMPSSKRFVRSLHSDRGVEAVVSFQTNVDLLTLGFSWDQMVALLRSGGVRSARHVPIPDFDVSALALALPRAIEAISDLRREGLVTYAHCTAGINRSPTVVIAYLIAHEGYSLDQAWDLVHAKRRVFPLRESIERWLTNLAKAAAIGRNQGGC